jgi:peptidoglycan/LPS O-acetylase OafA/YrhL
MNYRREIDGLRAFAVIPVILFHAGFQTFSGGFVGVDVFFVISGYLITSIILEEKHAGAFTLVGFYERRARRILPALFLVMFACLPFAWLWLPPLEMTNFSQSLVAVSGFFSNIYFYLKSDYFDTAAELKPLLHTWSLAVEEQYYLLFPIFLLAVWRFGKRWIVAMLTVVAIMSLALAQWGSFNHQMFTFFLLPTRGWEILVGAFIAFFPFTKGRGKSTSKRISQGISIVGVALITYAVFVFDKQTPFPGVYALVPTIGTALIILFATEQTLIGKLLGSKLFVGVGLISYSAYLWHQPLFAFARHRSIDEPGKLFLSGLAVVALVLAYVSWKYVETPFRNRQRFTRNQVFLYGASCSVFFVAFGLVGQFKNGFESRLSIEERELMAYSNFDYTSIYRRRLCFLDPDQSYSDFSKVCQVSGTDQSTLIWGDSLAAGLSVGLRKELSNVIQYTASNCPPLIDAEVVGRSHCKEINDYVMREVQRIKPEQIYLLADWISHKEQKPTIIIQKTIAYIHNVSPSTQITIIGPFPQWLPTLPARMLNKRMAIENEQYVRSSGFNDSVELDKEFDAVSKENDVKYFSAINALCVQDKCQATTTFNGELTLTAWDFHHLTEGGSALLVKKLLGK